MFYKKIGSTQKKLFILLLGGLSLILSSNPRRQFKIISQTQKEWQKIDQANLRRSIRSLYQSQLIDLKENKNGTVTVKLNKNGEKVILSYKLEEMKIKIPSRWDKKWRIIIFDIPEKLKEARNAIRFHLKRLGFYKLQKSVFVLPYECKNEIDFLIELYDVRPYVRQIVADQIDNALHLRNIFKIQS